MVYDSRKRRNEREKIFLPARISPVKDLLLDSWLSFRLSLDKTAARQREALLDNATAEP